jgi:hypothetical protein
VVSTGKNQPDGKVIRFDRTTFSGREKFTCIGTGSLGAKAHGLARIAGVLESRIAPRFHPLIHVDIPLLTVIASDYYDVFMSRNGLLDDANASRNDDQIASAFQRAELPADLVGDLRAFLARIRVPLAIRSSSLLEDAMGEPFAGIYATDMVPNNQSDLEDRLRSLMRAVKYIYASTFFTRARDYRRAAGRADRDEKMAVMIQEVVGSCHGGRFYPHISGVARSFNFYPLGLAQPQEGVVDLALGLGKMIVENGISWPYSPAYPHVNPPYSTVRDLLKQTQREFWAIDMSGPPHGRPSDTVEHLRKYPISDAEQDGTLSCVASTYNAEDDRIMMGIRASGPRIVDFAHIVKGEMIPLTLLVSHLLTECAGLLGTMVTIEFALTWDKDAPPPARFGLLQVRPMVVSNARVHVRPEHAERKDVLVASESALGNGRLDGINDIVYLKTETFGAAHTKVIGVELEEINRKLVTERRPYVLIGFGRWGTSDPSAGIPINFAQISGAKVIVEMTWPGMDFALSQGSHFFHNVTSFKILYFSVSHTGKHMVDWTWLNAQPLITETAHVRHARTPRPLRIIVDGRTSRGVIYKSDEK